MKWYKKKEPVKGQVRYKKKFAFLPVLLDNGIYIWFEFYWKVQTYYVPHIRGAGIKGWKTINRKLYMTSY